MNVRPERFALVLGASLVLLMTAACARRALAPATTVAPPATETASAAAAATPPATATVSTTPAAPGSPGAGTSFQVGSWTVIAERYRAQISSPDGVNIRSSPEIKPDNRVGSLPNGAFVEVEGRVPQGQEAEAGNGTTWFYVGLQGTTPQFIYGPSGTLTPANGAVAPSGSPAPALTPAPTLAATPTPS